VFGSWAFSVDGSNFETQIGSLLHRKYLENSVSGSMSMTALIISCKGRVQSELQWITCEIWLAGRRRIQNFNREINY
jgi:hypothetical protein